MSVQPCRTDKSHLASCNYGLVKLTDMPEEMRAEAKDTVVTALEKNPDPDKYEVCRPAFCCFTAALEKGSLYTFSYPCALCRLPLSSSRM